jgi:hypothetical protein
VSVSQPADVSMSADAADALQMVRQLDQQLTIRQGDVARWQRYYDGLQPLRFATEEYQKFFGKQYEGFRDNWCAPVVDTLAEKLTVAGLKVPESAAGDEDGDMAADRDFARVWAMNECQEQSSQAFVEACIARRAFALCWGDDDDPETPEITFESPDEVIIGYEPGARRKRLAALKRWTDGEYDFATLYTPDLLWKWQARIGGEKKLWTPDPNMRAQWVPRFNAGDDIWPIPNPSGVVPMVELANRPRLRSEPLSEVEGVAAMQDAINALWAYLFTTSDFAALPQRVLLGATLPKLPLLDKDGQPTGAFKPIDPTDWMKAAANRRMQAFEGENAKIAQWDAADLEAFTKTIEFAVGHVAAQSRTPAHYFVTGKISNISADGLTALGQAHIAKAKERSVYLGSGVRELAVVSYLMRGDKARADAARLGTVEWCEFETQSKAQTADYALKLRQAEFSFTYIASQIINDPVELADEIARHEVEQAQKAALLEFGPKPPSADQQMPDAPDGGMGDD